MPTRLAWDTGSDDDLEVGQQAPPRGARPKRRLRLTPLLLVGYVAALAVAGFLGFHLGRMSVVEAEQERSIETQLDIEALAWRDADEGLYRSILDLESDEAWREERVAWFLAHSPQPYEIELLEREAVDETTARVRVNVTLPDGSYTEVRVYRLANGVWGLTPDS